MRLLYITALAFTLTACSSNKPQFSPNTPESIKAFAAICLNSAPSFAGAERAAANYHITELKNLGSSISGLTSDNRMGVQIKTNSECVITTVPHKSTQLTAQFIQAVTSFAKTAAVNKVPFTAKVNGVTYVFLHDRQGGEAFVMLKR